MSAPPSPSSDSTTTVSHVQDTHGNKRPPIGEPTTVHTPSGTTTGGTQLFQQIITDTYTTIGSYAQQAMISSSNSVVYQQVSNTLYNLHPGHVCSVGSVPFLIYAYRGYHHSLETVVQKMLSKHHGIITSAEHVDINTVVKGNTPLEDSIRRSIGVSVASRALRVATAGSIGVFLFGIGMIFYSTGSKSVAQAIHNIKYVAQRYRIAFDQSIYRNSSSGSSIQDKRIDENHPEYTKIRAMTEDEELEYFYQTYIQPDEENDGIEKIGVERVDDIQHQ